MCHVDKLVPVHDQRLGLSPFSLHPTVNSGYLGIVFRVCVNMGLTFEALAHEQQPSRQGDPGQSPVT